MSERLLVQNEEQKDLSSSELISANKENFPVGSFFIPHDCRPHVHALYVFARHADDIADSKELSEYDKLEVLNSVQNSLSKNSEDLPKWAIPYHDSLKQTGNSPCNGVDLLTAFIQDATKSRYQTWDELMDYCMHSAAPVGRALIEIHGEVKADISGSDALCCALQMLNHMQDCRSDYLSLDRVYLPEPWFEEAGCSVTDLGLSKASPAVRNVLDRCLIKTEYLLTQAEGLPKSIRRRGLRIESAIILKLAWALAFKLRHQDPLSYQVKVGRVGWLMSGLKGLFSSW